MSEIAVDFLMGPDKSSALISWFGLGPGGFSHCASVLADGRYLDARNDVVPSGNLTALYGDKGVPAGVHIRDPKMEKWIYKRTASLTVSASEYAAWEANLRAKIGDAYGRSDIMEFIFDRGDHPPAHYICSALAINAVQHLSKSWAPGHLGYVPPLVIPAHQISPNAALIILQTAGFTIGPVVTPS